MNNRTLKSVVRCVVPLALAGVAGVAHADPIVYISSFSGYVMHQSATGAVTAGWHGQPRISGFADTGGRLMSAAAA